jgi:hypothetical protein
MAKLSCGRMIRLHAHHLPLLFRQQVASLSQSSCVSPVDLTDWKGVGEGAGVEPNYRTTRKPGNL